MESGNLLKRVTGSVMKFFKRLLLLLLIPFAIFLAIAYWGKYESGIMAGKVLRISEKGFVFKTWEGKLGLDTFGALKGVSPIAETFDFSVQKSDTAVISSLQKVALSGERVNLHYVKRYVRFFWRGDTRYFITEVERAVP